MLPRLPSSAPPPGPGQLWGRRLVVRIASGGGDLLLAGLSLLAGFRANELVALRADCLVTETRHGQTVVGLRSANLKTRGRGNDDTVRWLSHKSGVLATALVSRLLELTAGAREQARRNEAASAAFLAAGRPDRIAGPDHWHAHAGAGTEPPMLLLRPALAEAGFQTGVARPRPGVVGVPNPETGVPFHPAFAHHIRKQGPSLAIPAPRLEEALALWRGPLEHRLPDGSTARTSELLFINTRGSFAHHGKGTVRRPFYTDRIVVPDLAAALGDWTGRPAPSVFARYGISWRDADGVEHPCTLRMHMPRHFVTNMAHRAGMTAYQVHRWMHRASLLQTQAYFHGELYTATSTEVASFARAAIEQDLVLGARATDTVGLATEVRAEQLERTLTAAHVVPRGLCTADFERGDQCRYNRACSLRCDYYLVHMADPGTLVTLRRSRDDLNSLLGRMDAPQTNGAAVALSQRVFYEEERDRLQAILDRASTPLSVEP